MRTKESLPVYRHMGTAYDPPEATTPARAKRIIRMANCKFTGSTRTIVRAVYHSTDKVTGADIIRTSVIERKPERPLSTGFHTLAEKQAEAAERDAAWRALSLTDQLAALDKRLGVGVGAVKQRAKLTAAITAAAVAAKNPQPKGAALKGGVNQKHTADEKLDKQVRHAQAVVANHPTTRRRGPQDAKK